MLAGLRPHTVWNYDAALRLLEKFNRARKVEAWTDWDGDRAIDFVGWLRSRRMSDSWLRSAAEMSFRLIEALQILDPASVSPEFYAPKAHLPVLSPAYRDDDGLRPDILQRILAAALKETSVVKRVSELRDLAPFGVLLAILTGINADSLYGLERECLVPADGDYYVGCDAELYQALIGQNPAMSSKQYADELLAELEAEGDK
jgi:hypothetical protein